MQENNFEKQVQQKTSELKLRPSEEVWQKVSLSIAKRKTDRKIFALALLLLLFTGTAVFVIWGPSAESKTEKNIAIKDPAEIKGTNSRINTDKDDITETTPAVSTATNNKNTTDANINIKKKNQQEISPAGSPSLANASKRGRFVVVKNEDQDTKKYKEDLAVQQFNRNKLSGGSKGKTKVAIKGNEPDELEAEIVKADKVTTDITDPSTTPATIINQQVYDTVSKDKKVPAKPLTDTSVNVPLSSVSKVPYTRKSASSRSRKWTLGLRLSGGIAATKSSYLGLGPGSGNEERAYNDAVQANPGGSGSGQGVIYHTPSVVKTGKGFMVGAYAQKNIGTKTSILIGLNYKTYSSSLSIGERVDSSAYYNFNSNFSFFYRSGTKVQYTNHFHFIELPVLLRYRLSKQTGLPVYAEAGLTVSQLVSSNVLQFDATYGSYYNDSKPLNKTMVNVSAGLLFSLSRNSPHPFLIGPDFNFSLNKMAGAGLYENRRYSYFGLQLQKVFGKK